MLWCYGVASSAQGGSGLTEDNILSHQLTDCWFQHPIGAQ